MRMIGLLSEKMNLLKKVFLAIDGFEMIRPGEGVLVAVSGGPDSMCLLHVLLEINRIQNYQWRIVVGHVNHGLRGAESDQDEEFVRQAAADLKLEVLTRRVDVRAIRERQGLSLEEAARKARHHVLRTLAIENRLQKIAMGHNLDDQAETILFRTIRGTGLRGLRGMPPIRVLSKKEDLFVVRPLLEVERREILDFLKERKIGFRVDSSNADPSIARNYLRNDLIPALEKRLNPRLKQALVKLGLIARSAYYLLWDLSREVFENVRLVEKEGEVNLSVQELAKYPPAIQTLVIDRSVKHLLGRLPHLAFEHYVGVLSLLSPFGHGKVVQLPAGLQASRASYALTIGRPRPLPPAPRLLRKRLVVPGTTRMERLGITFRTELVKGDLQGLREYLKNKDYTEEVVDAEKVQFPLTVRFRKRGDAFLPLGAPGHQRLAEFFIDQHVPKERRSRVPLVVDRTGRIIWVVGYRISDEVKIRDTTRHLLRFKVTREEETAKS